MQGADAIQRQDASFLRSTPTSVESMWRRHERVYVAQFLHQPVLAKGERTGATACRPAVMIHMFMVMKPSL